MPAEAAGGTRFEALQACRPRRLGQATVSTWLFKQGHCSSKKGQVQQKIWKAINGASQRGVLHGCHGLPGRYDLEWLGVPLSQAYVGHWFAGLG